MTREIPLVRATVKLVWLFLIPRLESADREVGDQHRCRHSVDEPCRQRDIAIPELLEVQLYRFAMDVNVCDSPAHRDDRLADPEGRRETHRLDGDVVAGPRSVPSRAGWRCRRRC